MKRITRGLIFGSALLCFLPMMTLQGSAIGLRPNQTLAPTTESTDETTEETKEETKEQFDVVTEYEPINVSADSYVVIDLQSQRIVADKDMMTIYRPASTTKILTALVVLEQVDDLEEEITFSRTATVDNLTKDSSTLNPAAVAGEQMTVKDALYGMMLCSGNECANALAEHVAGSNEAFAKLMNDKAREIGCRNSHFANPSGLDDDDHYTTAYDLALIAMAAMENSKFAQIDTSRQYTIPPTNIYPMERKCEMGHKMLNGKCPYPGVYAGKTGQTELAKRVLVTFCRKDDSDVVCVIMHAEEEAFYNDTMVLLDYADKAIPRLALEAEENKKQWETAEDVKASVEAAIEEATRQSLEEASREAAIKASEEAEEYEQTTQEQKDLIRVLIGVGALILVLLIIEIVGYIMLQRKNQKK